MRSENFHQEIIHNFRATVPFFGLVFYVALEDLSDIRDVEDQTPLIVA